MCIHLAIQSGYLQTTVSRLTLPPILRHGVSRHAHTGELALFLPSLRPHNIARLPPHLDASALTLMNAVQTDLLRDAIWLVGSEVAAGLWLELELESLHHY